MTNTSKDLGPKLTNTWQQYTEAANLNNKCSQQGLLSIGNTLSYLALVSSVVALLHVFDLQRPVVGPFAVQHLEPLVVGVREHARRQYVPVTTAHPRYLHNTSVQQRCIVTGIYRRTLAKRAAAVFIIIDIYKLYGMLYCNKLACKPPPKLSLR